MPLRHSRNSMLSAPFPPERTDNFPVAANETAADMLCCALYPRIQTFPSTDLHLHEGDLVSRGVDALTKERVGRTIDSFWWAICLTP